MKLYDTKELVDELDLASEYIKSTYSLLLDEEDVTLTSICLNLSEILRKLELTIADLKIHKG